MKRIIALMLTAVFALALAGCDFFKIPDQGGMENPNISDEVSDRFGFASEDVYGKAVAFSDFADKKVIMLNLWETWCPPCVGEIPDLVRLADKYTDEGFAVIGAFGSSEEDDVKAMAADLGISYTLMAQTGSMEKYQSGYVPTTVFFDGEGNRLTESYVGAKSYEEWETIILGLLGK